MKNPLFAMACTPEWINASDPNSDKPALPRFSMIAYTGGPMVLAGWRHPVVVDLSGIQIPSQRRPIRLGHESAFGVGHTESVTVEGGKLVAQGVVSRDTDSAREVVISSKNGFPWQASIGASVVKYDFLSEGETATVNGQVIAGPANIVRTSVLGEISFVDLGADGNTSAQITASNQQADLSATEPERSAMDKELLATLTKLAAAHPTLAAAIVAKAAENGATADSLQMHVKELQAAEDRRALEAHIADLKAQVEAITKAKADAESAVKASNEQVAKLQAQVDEAKAWKASMGQTSGVKADAGGTEDHAAKIDAAWQDPKVRGCFGSKEILAKALKNDPSILANI